MDKKVASTDHPVHDHIKARWSPYGYSDNPLAKEDLLSLFEAARWAPSSYNEQPWSYIVATKDDPEEFERLVGCLVEANQEWARQAPVLVLCVATMKFKRNDKPNKAAEHDLGLAAGNICHEATERGLFVHQMIGILPDVARDTYSIPDGSEAVTAMAIGYAADPETLSDKFQERDTTPRERKPLAEFVFSGQWGATAGFVKK